MENKFSFIDNDGNLSEDENKFIQEYTYFFANNPDKLEQLKEAEQRSKEYENLQYRKLEALEFALQHGDFKQGIEFWFRSQIKKIESKKNDTDYFDFLTRKKTGLKRLIIELKKQINLYPDTKERNEFWILSIKGFQNEINTELKRLKGTKKQKGIAKIGVGEITLLLTLMEDILEKINALLFDNSNLSQWEFILNSIEPPTPIKVKAEITLKDLRYFFDKLAEHEIFIRQYLTPLSNINAFLFKGNTIKYNQLTQAKKDFKNAIPPHQTEIDIIFKRYE